MSGEPLFLRLLLPLDVELFLPETRCLFRKHFSRILTNLVYLVH